MSRSLHHSTSLFAALVACATVFAAPVLEAQERPINIAVVDLEEVVAQSIQGKSLQARLNRFQAEARAEGERQAASVKVWKRKLELAPKTMKPAELDDLQHTYEQALSDLRQYQDRKQREGQKIQQDGLKAIEKALQPIFEMIRDEKKIDLILNNTPGVVVMVGERVDITKLVLARANAAAKGGGR